MLHHTHPWPLHYTTLHYTTTLLHYYTTTLLHYFTALLHYTTYLPVKLARHSIRCHVQWQVSSVVVTREWRLGFEHLVVALEHPTSGRARSSARLACLQTYLSSHTHTHIHVSYSITPSHMHISLTYTHSLAQSLTHPLPHSLAQTLPHSLPPSLPHSLTHSPEGSTHSWRPHWCSWLCRSSCSSSSRAAPASACHCHCHWCS